MKTKIFTTFSLLIIAGVLLGCTQTPINNLPSGDENTILSEAENSWVTDSEMLADGTIATNADVVASETANETINETDEVDAGAMI